MRRKLILALAASLFLVMSASCSKKEDKSDKEDELQMSLQTPAMQVESLPG